MAANEIERGNSVRTRSMRFAALTGILRVMVVAFSCGAPVAVGAPQDSSNTGGNKLLQATERSIKAGPSPCASDDDSLAPAMVVIPPGQFLMGSPKDEMGRNANEGPQHWVTIPRPFAIGRCEVTVREFQRFTRDTRYVTDAEKADAKGCNIWDSEKKKGAQTPGHHWQNPGFPQAELHPVVCLSQADVLAYLEWLSQRTGARYRLPSEAEWEYAARGGTTTAYWWGTEVGVNLANCDGCESQWDNKQTAPVGSFAPNPFGLYDTAGNVWEWTADCWHESYAKAPVDGTAWLAAQKGDCGMRVVRGGSWINSPRGLRPADRNGDETNGDKTGGANNLLGFRILRDL